jgi:hypothetical protein
MIILKADYSSNFNVFFLHASMIKVMVVTVNVFLFLTGNIRRRSENYPSNRLRFGGCLLHVSTYKAEVLISSLLLIEVCFL